jgi:hypothetical protein
LFIASYGTTKPEKINIKDKLKCSNESNKTDLQKDIVQTNKLLNSTTTATTTKLIEGKQKYASFYLN